MKKWVAVGIVMLGLMAGCASGGYWTKEASQEQIDRDKQRCRDDAAAYCEYGKPGIDAISINGCIKKKYDDCMIHHGFKWVEGE